MRLSTLARIFLPHLIIGPFCAFAFVSYCYQYISLLVQQLHTSRMMYNVSGLLLASTASMMMAICIILWSTRVAMNMFLSRIASIMLNISVNITVMGIVIITIFIIFVIPDIAHDITLLLELSWNKIIFLWYDILTHYHWPCVFPTDSIEYFFPGVHRRAHLLLQKNLKKLERITLEPFEPARHLELI